MRTFAFALLALTGCDTSTPINTDAGVLADARPDAVADATPALDSANDTQTQDTATDSGLDSASNDARADAGGVIGDTFALTSQNRLISFTRLSATVQSSVAVSGIGAGETAVGIDFRAQNRQLYVLTRDTTGAAKLYAVDTNTGAVDASPLTLTGATLATSAMYSIDFNPAADALRIVGTNGDNFRANLTSNAFV